MSLLALESFLTRQVILGTCAFGVACVLGVLPATAEDDKHDRATDDSRTIRIYRDPKTGKVVPPPKGVPSLPHPGHSTSHQGLVETPSPVPGGGVMIDLQERFRSPLTATPADDGKARIQHSNPTPAPSR